MEQNRIITEGFLGKLANLMLEDLPTELKNAADDYVNLKKTVEDIAKKYLVRIVDNDTASYEFSQKPDSDSLKKFAKKKKYMIDKIEEKLKKEYQDALGGDLVNDLTSPYNESGILILETTGFQKAEAIRKIQENTDAFFESMKNTKPVRDGISFFFGFYKYPYINLYRAYDAKNYKKMILLDVEEYILRLSFENKYENFAYYTPESLGKMFYSENKANRKKEDEEERDLELSGMQYLQSTFFSGQTGLSNINIRSAKTWDQKDFMILAALVTKSISSGISNRDAFEVGGTFTEIGNLIYPEAKKLSSKHNEIVANRLSNIFDTRIEAIGEDGTIFRKTLFDHVKFGGRESSGETDHATNSLYYSAELGRSITADILASKLDMIVRHKIAELESPVGKLLYTELKRDRAYDLLLRNVDFHEYTLISFMLIVKVNETKKPKRIEKYLQALEEMSGRGVLIKSFRWTGKVFRMEWLPLSEEEKRDMKVFVAGEDQKRLN